MGGKATHKQLCQQRLTFSTITLESLYMGPQEDDFRNFMERFQQEADLPNDSSLDAQSFSTGSYLHQHPTKQFFLGHQESILQAAVHSPPLQQSVGHINLPNSSILNKPQDYVWDQSAIKSVALWDSSAIPHSEVKRAVSLPPPSELVPQAGSLVDLANLCKGALYL
ncbi:hypothetical protein DL93DRAFT_2098185 [Clavulina sp. PMI_390]|nr:hypothetical protein DL93DRAFT_2098185 [Clavulina sp. PMI_390]